jgi:peptidoglycan hydrolase-like protein with peptidoglycan-binding domain
MFRKMTLLAAGILVLGSMSTLAAQQATPPKQPAAQHQRTARPMRAHTWTAAQIKEAQTALIGLKLYTGPADGTMNKETTDAIRQFQGSHHMRTTGRLSDSLLVLLKAPPTPAK